MERRGIIEAARGRALSRVAMESSFFFGSNRSIISVRLSTVPQRRSANRLIKGMQPKRQKKIEDLFHRALAHNPEQREAFLKLACDGDHELLEEVRLLMEQDSPTLTLPPPSPHHGRSLEPGTRLGPYEILDRLGEGGMGEVYRAMDTRLGRMVAVKTTKEMFSQRFEREARAIAALNHPHICTLYDVGPNYLVMELVEGETLSRLNHGRLSVGQAIEYGVQIASALAVAHSKGIVHRDLKPGNIMVTKSGVKVLDFGLAKWKQDPLTAGSVAQVPAEDPLTLHGTVLGTLPYMSPEQLEGKEVDARSDIFAFGAVLFEMVTGRRPFEGTSSAGLMAKILEADPPPLGSLQPLAPAALDRLVRRCLVKDRTDRFQSAQDVKLALTWIRDEAEEPRRAGAHAEEGWRRAIPWGLFAAAALAFGVVAWLRGTDARGEAQEAPSRFEVPLPKELARFTASISLSPDGRKLGFAAVGSDGTSRLWIRDLDSLNVHPLAGTESVGSLLVWSPDSKFIAFDSSGTLKRIDVAGGPAKTLCRLDRVIFSGSWGKSGAILYGGVGGPIMRVPEGGGDPAPVTALDSTHGDVAHTNPRFLEDEEHFLYLRDTATDGQISVGSLNAKPEEQDPRRLIEGVHGPNYIPSLSGGAGRLLFIRGLTLMSQSFDSGQLLLSGEPAPVIDAPIGPFLDTGLYAVANNGTLVYRSLGNPQSQLTWLDDKGAVLSKVGAPGVYSSLALSPDSKQALVSKTEATGRHTVWLVDTASGTTTPLANDPSMDYPGGVWSPNQRSIIFGLVRSGQMANLYRRPINGTSSPEELLTSDRWKTPLSWSPDDFLLFGVAGNGHELWTLSLKEPKTATPLLRGAANYKDGQLSRDGKWLAYESDESSRDEIYVRSFSGGQLGEGKRVSLNGGSGPRWGDDNRLYYVGLDNNLMTLKLTLRAGVEAETPTVMFPAPHAPSWAPAANGKRFLFLAPEQQQDTPIVVVLNRWAAQSR
jgi:eukaryotic-like serine/threonine-protein kinase